MNTLAEQRFREEQGRHIASPPAMPVALQYRSRQSDDENRPPKLEQPNSLSR